MACLFTCRVMADVNRLSEAQIFARELVDRRAAHQLHSSFDLGPHQAKGALNAGLAGRRERIKIESSGSNGFGSQRKCLQDMGSALNPAVHDDVDLVADSIDDFRQLIERGARTVELPAAMIGQYDTSAADLNGAFGIGHRHDAFKAELSVP